MVRHGETDWNVAEKIQGQTDIPLNETGLLQAKALGEKLAKENLPVQKIYSSIQKRARQTAQAISESLHLPVETSEGIQEITFGDWEGKSWKEISIAYPDYYPYWHKNRRYARTPNGESYQNLLERTVKALRQIIETEKAQGNTQGVIVVSHSAVIMGLQCWLHDDPFHEMVHKYRMENGAVIEIDSAEIINRPL